MRPSKAWSGRNKASDNDESTRVRHLKLGNNTQHSAEHNHGT
jgi:hypothetical protein